MPDAGCQLTVFEPVIAKRILEQHAFFQAYAVCLYGVCHRFIYWGESGAFAKHAYFACRMPKHRSPKQCSLLPSVIAMHFAKLTYFEPHPLSSKSSLPCIFPSIRSLDAAYRSMPSSCILSRIRTLHAQATIEQVVFWVYLLN